MTPPHTHTHPTPRRDVNWPRGPHQGWSDPLNSWRGQVEMDYNYVIKENTLKKTTFPCSQWTVPKTQGLWFNRSPRLLFTSLSLSLFLSLSLSPSLPPKWVCSWQSDRPVSCGPGWLVRSCRLADKHLRFLSLSPSLSLSLPPSLFLSLSPSLQRSLTPGPARQAVGGRAEQQSRRQGRRGWAGPWLRRPLSLSLSLSLSPAYTTPRSAQAGIADSISSLPTGDEMWVTTAAGGVFLLSACGCVFALFRVCPCLRASGERSARGLVARRVRHSRVSRRGAAL